MATGLLPSMYEWPDVASPRTYRALEAAVIAEVDIGTFSSAEHVPPERQGTYLGVVGARCLPSSCGRLPLPG